MSLSASLSEVDGLSRTWPGLYQEVSGKATPGRSAASAQTSTNKDPVTDVVLVASKDQVPPGYRKIEKTMVTNKKSHLHAHSRDHPLYLCVARERGAPPVTSIVLLDDQHGEPLPPGYVRIDRTPSGRSACLQSESDGSSLVLCIKRGRSDEGGNDISSTASKSGSPTSIVEAPSIVSIGFVQAGKAERPPPGHASAARSPYGRDTRIHSGKGSGSLLLVFQHSFDMMEEHIRRAASGANVARDVILTMRALYSRDNTVAGAALASMGEMLAQSGASSGNGESRTLSSSTTSSSVTFKTGTLISAESSSIASALVTALCDTADAHPATHLELILDLLETMTRLPHFLETCKHGIDRGAADSGLPPSGSEKRPPPRNLLRIVGSIIFLYSLFGDDNIQGASSSAANSVRESAKTCMSTLMKRVDETNPLGADLIIEKRLLREASRNSEALPSEEQRLLPPHFAVELILAHVHELRSSMVAAHDAVVATLTLAGQHRQMDNKAAERPSTYTTATAPYSDRWMLEMDSIGRRLFPGHEPPRAVFDTIAFLCQIAHADLSGHDSNSEPGADSGLSEERYVPRRQSDLCTKIGALSCLRFLLESAGIGFRHGDSCGLVVRGLVVQCVLENCPLHSPQVFKEVLSLLTVLWTSYRRHLKVELTILFNDVILKVLRSVHCPPERKVEVLKQLIDQWFAQPSNLVELYLNFDNDQVNATDANIYGGMCEVLCALAEGRAYGASTREKYLMYNAGDSADEESDNGEDVDDGSGSQPSLASRRRRLRRVALDALARITRCLMDTSATVHLMHRVNKAGYGGGDGSSTTPTHGVNARSGDGSAQNKNHSEIILQKGNAGWESRKHEDVNWDLQTSSLYGKDIHGDRSIGNTRTTGGANVISGGRYSPYDANPFGTPDLTTAKSGEESTLTPSVVPATPPSINSSLALPAPSNSEKGGMGASSSQIRENIPRNSSFSSNESGGSVQGSPPSIMNPKVSSLKGRVRSASDFGPATEKLASAVHSSHTPQPEGSTRSGSALSLARHGRRASVRLRHDLRQEKIGIAEKAVSLAHSKSLRKAMDMLLQSGHISPSPGEFCNWIRDHIDAIDDKVVGDYLGEEGLEAVSPSGEMAPPHRTISFMKQFRDTFIGAMSFAGMGFVPALRHMLTQGGFRIPGEAQKIERILQSFANCYYAANKESLGDIEDADVVLVLAFATVMLNTDRYNPAIKKSRKMTLSQFKGNMRGQGVSNAILDGIWNDILAEEIQMPKVGQDLADTVSRGGKKGNPASAESHGGDKIGRDGETYESLKMFERSMLNAAQRARAKLSGHAAMCRVYFTKMSTELVNLMFEISWPFFYRCITLVLDEEESRNGRQRQKERELGVKQNSVESAAMTRPGHLELVACVLDLLRYSISACLCLGMETERRAFAALLAKFHFFHSNTGEWDSIGDVMVFGHEESTRTTAASEGQLKHKLKSMNTMTREILSGKHLEQTWFKHVMQTSAHDSDAIMDVISEVHQLASRLRNRVMLEHRSRSLIRTATIRFVKKDADYIMSFEGHSNRSLLKEGSLVRHTHSGKRKRYRFFLFSDLFLYASGGGRSKYKVHNFLPLESLEVKNQQKSTKLGVAESQQKTGEDSLSFYIESPVKSFVVSAPTAARKRGWVQAINGACQQLEIDQLEAIKQKMLKQAAEDEQLAGGASQVQDSSAPTNVDAAQGMGSKRISMIDRFELSVSTANTDSASEQQAWKRQSKAMQDIATPKNSKSLLSPFSDAESKEASSVAQLSDQKLKELFQRGLTFSRPILEGTHSKFSASDEQKLMFYALFKQAVAGEYFDFNLFTHDTTPGPS